MEAVDKVDGLRMVGGADPGERGRKIFRGDYADLPLYDSQTELLAKERPDIVAICTREEPRFALTMEALDAGVKAIVLEKPMARNVDEAREMTRAAAARGIPVVVSHQMRFCDEFVAARDAIRAGEIGTPYYVRASSFGHLMEQGPHMVDMLLWLLDEPEVDWVMGSVADIAEGRGTVHPAPAFVVGYIAFQNGARAVLECGRSFQKSLTMPQDVTWMQKRMQVFGTEGMTDSIVRAYATLLNAQGSRVLYEGVEGWDKATIGLYRELGDVLRHGGTHRNNAEASLRGFEIIHAIYASALANERVRVPIAEGARPLEILMGSA